MMYGGFVIPKKIIIYYLPSTIILFIFSPIWFNPIIQAMKFLQKKCKFFFKGFLTN